MFLLIRALQPPLSLSLTLLLPLRCSRRVNSVQRLRHSLLRADRLLEKHEDEVMGQVQLERSSDGGGEEVLLSTTYGLRILVW